LQNAQAELAFDIARICRDGGFNVLTRALKLTLLVEIEPAAAGAGFGEVAVGADGSVIIARCAFEVAEPLLGAGAACKRAG